MDKRILKLLIKYFLDWMCNLIAVVYISSAIFKAYASEKAIKTINFIFVSFWGLHLNFFLEFLMLFIVCIVESAAGIAYLLSGVNNRPKLKILTILLTMTVFFLILSHWLISKGRLGSCGCFGDFIVPSQTLHFSLLYLFALVIIMSILLTLKNKKHRPTPLENLTFSKP